MEKRGLADPDGDDLNPFFRSPPSSMTDLALRLPGSPSDGLPAPNRWPSTSTNWVAGTAIDYGHVELVYDFAAGTEADGWLHGLFRYEDRTSGHAAETSFGAHIFNTALVYKNEPQSYSGHPPGLSTRLFLRLGADPFDTLCHLVYPASTPWHAVSSTDLILTGGDGTEIARQRVAIPCSGSLFWRYHEMFDSRDRRRAGDRGYVIVRDVTCRLLATTVSRPTPDGSAWTICLDF